MVFDSDTDEGEDTEEDYEYEQILANSTDPTATANELFVAYRKHKRRWRKFMNRRPRRFRLQFRRSGKA